MMKPVEVMQEIVKALDGKKANSIEVLKTESLTVLADYFVICTANSTTHIKTLADEVQKQLEAKGEQVRRVEGYRAGGWVLLDYACVVVHLFLRDTREFYALERLWNDAEKVDISRMLVTAG